ncbi:hypothetical protein [Streptomyces sp. NPDC058678]|uniref:hypothetical protein n=1 Tax=Streptomyces sp. NPDC058678 TaxID=3346595 RepID=UPI003663D13F
MVFFTLTAVAAPTVYFTRRMRADVSALLGSCAVIPAAVLTLGALYLAGPVLLFAGAALAGFGFGAVSQGALRAVVDSVPAREKGGTLASYYVLSYLAMSLPAIGAGAPTPQLRTACGSTGPCRLRGRTGDRRSRDADLAAAQSAPDTSLDAHSRPATSNHTSASPDTPAPDISVLATHNR